MLKCVDLQFVDVYSRYSSDSRVKLYPFYNTLILVKRLKYIFQKLESLVFLSFDLSGTVLFYFIDNTIYFELISALFIY